jgi:hypothetical protein
VDDLVKQARDHAAGMGWVPVDQVPEEWKDGRELLAYWSGSKVHAIVEHWAGKWIDADNLEVGPPTHLRDPDDLHSDPTAALLVSLADAYEAPIPMLLFCPKCGLQHIDAPEDGFHEGADAQSGAWSPRWDNPPHRSHLCLGCGHIWRPCDRYTTGVAAIETAGKADGSPVPSLADEVVRLRGDLAHAYAESQANQTAARTVMGGFMDLRETHAAMTDAVVRLREARAVLHEIWGCSYTSTKTERVMTLPLDLFNRMHLVFFPDQGRRALAGEQGDG